MNRGNSVTFRSIVTILPAEHIRFVSPPRRAAKKATSSHCVIFYPQRVDDASRASRRRGRRGRQTVVYGNSCSCLRFCPALKRAPTSAEIAASLIEGEPGRWAPTSAESSFFRVEGEPDH